MNESMEIYAPNAEPLIIPVQPRYARTDGLVVTGGERPELDTHFEIQDVTYVTLPPGTVGGNHRHPRIEAFLPLMPGLRLHWLESDGAKQSRDLLPLELAIVPSRLPHAVENISENTIVMTEYADGVQHDVEPIEVI